MSRSIVAGLSAALVLAGCDLPTNVDEARARLARNQKQRIVPIRLPMPELSVTLADQLAGLTEIVDTTDLSFRVDPDTFAFGLDSLLTLDPVDPDPVTQGYDIEVSDFTRAITVTAPPIPVSLPNFAETLRLAPITPGGSASVPIDLGTAFSSATFGASSELRIVLTTDASASIYDVTAEIRDGGTTLASSSGSVSLAPSQTDSLRVALDGVTLPATFDLLLSFSSASGDGTGDELAADIHFADAVVVAATGVDASRVTPVALQDTVVLDQTGDDFSQATLAAGTVSVDSFSSGTLEFTPSFDGDLSGLQVGGTSPDSLVVGGEIGPPSGASTVDVVNTADLVVAFRNLEVESVTLNQVALAVDRTVPIAGSDSALDNLQEVTIASGLIQVDITNRLDIGGPVTLTLGGVVDSTGTAVSSQTDIQPSPDGTPTLTRATMDLSGAVLTPDSLQPRVAGTIGGTDVTVTPAIAADAVTVDPFVDVQPAEVVLNGIPDLDVALDQQVDVPAGEVELGELADLIDSLVFNDVVFTVTLVNGSGFDVRLDSLQMTLLDSIGAPLVRDGDTARVRLGDDSTRAVAVPADSSSTTTGVAHTFVNGFLDELAAGRDVRVRAGGRGAPASDSGSIALGDSLTAIFEMTLGPDVTIDPGGVVLDQVVAEAVDLDSVAAELVTDLSRDLVSAAVEFEAVNGMPLGLSVRMALAPTPGPADTANFDPLSADPNIEISGFAVPAGAVDSTGRVVAPTTDTAAVSVDPAELPILAEGLLGLGVEATIQGPTGGRARLQPTDSLVLRPLLKIELRVPGSSGGGS